ncbi:hypothetical protein [Bacteroides acidifaciens]|uniref:hypothetical protein n=1 Tax=Bacteroides acidifaciens TaxID=85831 RepID=UPI003014CC4A
MKQKSFIWRIMLMSMIAVMCACVSACSSDDPEPEPLPTPDPKENGEVVFDIKLPEGNGNGTQGSPVTVQKGEKLDMAISQKSSYTDPDGSVFTCEPKAEIVLFAKMDTVVAKDIAGLTKVKEGSDVKSSSNGTYPVRYQTTQTFEIGGQNIVFDLSHEVYTYINSMKDKIEMPYVKINQAKMGNTPAAEEKPQGRSTAVALTGVTVRPLATSRATTITDSTLYEVNAQFNLDIESVNAKKDAKQTLVFSVTYIGVVETTTELKDPESVVSFVWDVKSGTASTASPFVKTAGEPMEIWMNQSCRHSDEYGNELVGDPKAKIKLSVAQDTIWASSIEELKKVVNKSGDVSETQEAKQVFGTENQDITIDWSYEVATAKVGDLDVDMPYYVLNAVTLTDVSVKELGKKTCQGKVADLYEITAKFHQKATPKNITGEVVSEEIEYVVSYVGAVREIKDPESIVSFVWDIKGGTNSTASPFVQIPGESMEIWMNQSSRYTDKYGQEVLKEPKAKIKLSVAQDTVWGDNVEKLKNIVNKSGSVPETKNVKQVFGTDNQDITIDWSYETVTTEADGKEIAMAYYALEGATLTDVSVKELGYKVCQNKEADLYEITATFRQKATPKNITGKASSEEIEYVVSYVGAVEIKLEKVEYFPGGEWIDPHDNMALAYYAKVIRRRTYSNGAVQEDEFKDFGHPVQLMTSVATPGKYKYFTIYPPTDVVIGDSIRHYTRSFEFLSKERGFSYVAGRNKYTSEDVFTDHNWAGYKTSKLYDNDVNLAIDFSTSYPSDVRQSGWYFGCFIYTIEYHLIWDTDANFANITTGFEFYDQFLVIDGRRIDFTSFHNLKIDHQFDQQNFSTSSKEGAIMKLETNISYLGKKFRETRIDSLYVAK